MADAPFMTPVPPPPTPESVIARLGFGQEMELLYVHLQRVMDLVGFEDRNGSGHLMTRLRRLFNRSQLDQNEINILRGIFSAVEARRRTAQPPAP